MDFYQTLPRDPLVKNSRDYLVQYCQNKRVLHFGCVDTGVLEEKYQKGLLLHQRLAMVAKELWGFDINEEGIGFLKSKGFDNLIVGDASRSEDLQPLHGNHFDVILAGEIVEHLLNPGQFLDVLKPLMSPTTELIVTVPNAYGIDSILAMLRGKECVHPDHNYWFSYSTITTLISKQRYHIKQVMAYSNQLVPYWYRPPQTRFSRYLLSLVKRLLVRFLYRLTPFWGDGLIVVATYDKA